MKKLRSNGILIWAVLCGAPAVAAAQAPTNTGRAGQYFDQKEGLTLDALVNLAVTQAPSLAAARARIEAARGARRQAALRPNPTASFEQREQFEGPEAQTMVGFVWPLDLFRRGPRVAVADEAVRATEYWADDEVRERAAGVRERATEVLAALRQLTIAEDRARFAKSRTDVLAARAEAGAAPPLDRDLADVEWRRSETEVIAWQSAADRALAALKASVGLPADAPLRLAATLDQAATALPAIPSGDALPTRSDVRALEFEVRQADAEIARARSDARIDLGVYAAYMNRQPDPSLGGRMHEGALGLTVNLPWRNRQQGAIAAATATKRAAEFSLSARRLDARAEIDAARIREAAATQALALYRDGLMDLAQRNLGVVRESFDLGRGTLLDVIDEERRYLELQSAYTAALREVVDARTALLRALGMAS
jgi:cobalt-zinc-cadmium efflux system outer membrane protein